MQADLISRASISSVKTLFPNRATFRALGVMRRTYLLESVFNPVGTVPSSCRYVSAKAARGPEPMREEAEGQKGTRGVQTLVGDKEFTPRSWSEPGAGRAASSCGGRAAGREGTSLRAQVGAGRGPASGRCPVWTQPAGKPSPRIPQHLTSSRMPAPRLPQRDELLNE